MAEILHHQLYVIYETSDCFPYELLTFKIGSTWEVVQDFSHSEFQMFHVLDHHNVKIEGVRRNKSWSKVVQDFRHQQYHNIHDIKMMLVRSTICPALPWSESVPGLSGT